MSRRPTPTHLRLLRGNPGRRKLPENEPEVPQGAALMPPWLRHLDAIAGRFDERSLKELQARARELEIPRRSRMDRDELTDAILEASPGPRESGWRELEAMLSSMRVLTAADVHALALTVNVYVRYIEDEAALAVTGDTYETTGRYGLQIKRRPQAENASRRWDQAIKGLIEFGMTPASRTKVAAVPAGEESPFEKLRKRGGA